MKKKLSEKLFKSIVSGGVGTGVGGFFQSILGGTTNPNPNHEMIDSEQPNLTHPVEVYQREQYGMNSVSQQPFMGFPTWATGLALSNVMSPWMLRNLIGTFTAPSNEDAPRNRLSLSSLGMGLGMFGSMIPNPLVQVASRFTSLLGGMYTGSEIVAHQQGSSTDKVAPRSTTDMKQITEGYATKAPKAYRKHGYEPQAKVLEVMPQNPKNAEVSDSIQRTLIPDEEMAFEDKTLGKDPR